MVTELQDNSRYRLFEKFSRESILIILVSISCIVAIISFFRAEKAIDSANEANAIAETWQTMYSETERECRLAQMEIDDFKLVMMRAGLNIEHHGEKQ